MAKAESGGLDALAPDDSIESPVDIWARYPSLKQSKLFHEYLSRLTAGRDMNVFITAASETGVGKTTLAFTLAVLWDMHGWTADKATLSPREYDVLYDEVGKGSVLILDEAEHAVDNRRASSHENVDLSQAFATKRYQQIAGILTAPSRGWVDKRLGSDAADYWIQCHETPHGKPKGEATVYRLRNNEHYMSDYKTTEETISWPVLDWHPEFRKLEAKKAKRMEGKTEENYVPRSEVEDLKANYWNKASKKARYHIVRSMYEFGLAQKDIAAILKAADEVDGVGQSRVSNIVNADSFDEVYSS